MNNFQLTKNFNLSEFQCKCCGQVKVDSAFVKQLQAFREHLDKPIVSNSSYRCEHNNKEAGGTPDSYHKHGRAVDMIAYNSGKTVMELYRSAVEFGFNGVIAYPNKGIVHIDNRRDKKYHKVER